MGGSRCRVVITGGLGFVGQELCKAILKAGTLNNSEVREIVLLDVVEPDPKPAFCESPLVKIRVGDASDPALCHDLLKDSLADEETSIFHLAGIMSGQGEKDFDLCLRVNLDATRNLLEAARKVSADSAVGKPVRFVFASTGACFGETTDSPVSDTTKLVPLNTYGMTKACCELFVNDYTRKGFIDGRSARLPTVIVRPGKPNAATTSCYSGVIREPLHGVDVALPVDRDLPHAVTSTRALISNMVTLHDVTWPSGLVDRAVTLPSISITLGSLVDSLHRVVAVDDHAKLGKISDAPDPFLNGVVGGMACKKMSHSRALQLGLVEVPDTDTMVREFLEDFGEKVVVRAAPKVPFEPASRSVARRVAVVTGAGSGVGRSVASKLVEKADFNAVMLVGRRLAQLEETRAALLKAAATQSKAVEVLCATCDVRRPNEVAKVFAEVEAKFGRCDVVFNNAGVGAPAVPLEELPADSWQAVLDTNISGVFFCTQEAVKLMKRQEPQGGRIVNNGSVSCDRPRPRSCAYTASKHAVTGLTKSVALDGRAFNIACGQIDIGNALTDMSAPLADPDAGALQPSGIRVPEPTMDVQHAGDAVAYMASLPLEANVLFMTVMATKMPLVGRG